MNESVKSAKPVRDDRERQTSEAKRLKPVKRFRKIRDADNGAASGQQQRYGHDSKSHGQRKPDSAIEVDEPEIILLDAKKDMHKIQYVHNLTSSDEEDLVTKRRKLDIKLGLRKKRKKQKRKRIQEDEGLEDENKEDNRGSSKRLRRISSIEKMVEQRRGSREDALMSVIAEQLSISAERDSETSSSISALSVSSSTSSSTLPTVGDNAGDDGGNDGSGGEEEDEEVYVVEKILHKKVFADRRKEPQYLIKWKGYAMHEATWEVSVSDYAPQCLCANPISKLRSLFAFRSIQPESNIVDKSLIENYDGPVTSHVENKRKSRK